MKVLRAILGLFVPFELQPVYAAEATITLTLTSLGNGSWRQSTVVNNTTDLYTDALVGGSVQTGTLSAGGSIDFFCYGQTNDDPDYTGGASGTDGAYTADGEELLFPFLGTIITDDTDDDRDMAFGPWPVAPLFGGHLPQRWGIVVENNTGAALHATGTNNEVVYRGLNYNDV